MYCHHVAKRLRLSPFNSQMRISSSLILHTTGCALCWLFNPVAHAVTAAWSSALPPASPSSAPAKTEAHSTPTRATSLPAQSPSLRAYHSNATANSSNLLSPSLAAHSYVCLMLDACAARLQDFASQGSIASQLIPSTMPATWLAGRGSVVQNAGYGRSACGS